MIAYVPVKVGRQGRVIHAGKAYQNGRYTEYRQLCTVTNTHNVNMHPRATELPPRFAINCKHCLAIIEAEAQETRNAQ